MEGHWVCKPVFYPDVTSSVISSMTMWKISVALVTRNRPESLRRTLASLRAQGTQPYELIVSDDSDEKYVNDVRRIVLASGGKYISGPRQGLYANRNRAAMECSGTHVRTMDDDHEFPPGHLKACMRAIEHDPKAVWIIGETLPNRPIPPGGPFCPGEISHTWASVTPRDPDDCSAISDGAALYPRKIFDDGHRFYEGFRFGATYLEFGDRINAIGFRIRFLRDTYVIHHFDLQNRSYMNVEWDIASRGFAAFCHCFLYKPSLNKKILCILYGLRNAIPMGSVGFRALRAGYLAYLETKRRMRTPNFISR